MFQPVVFSWSLKYNCFDQQHVLPIFNMYHNLMVSDPLRKETVAQIEKMKQLERDLSSSFNKVKASEAAKKGLESKTNLYEEKIRQLEAKHVCYYLGCK